LNGLGGDVGMGIRVVCDRCKVTREVYKITANVSKVIDLRVTLECSNCGDAKIITDANEDLG
jgi:ribosomal protein S27AE